MERARFEITRRRALTLLLLILLLAPIPLMDIQQRSDPHAAPSSGPNWGWLFVVFVVMGSALRGNRSALGLWSALAAVIGFAMVWWSFSPVDGSTRLIGGFIALSASIVFALLRDELGDTRRPSHAPHDREDVRAS
jgi:hypothetical protein